MTAQLEQGQTRQNPFDWLQNFARGDGVLPSPDRVDTSVGVHKIFTALQACLEEEENVVDKKTSLERVLNAKVDPFLLDAYKMCREYDLSHKWNVHTMNYRREKILYTLAIAIMSDMVSKNAVPEYQNFPQNILDIIKYQYAMAVHLRLGADDARETFPEIQRGGRILQKRSLHPVLVPVKSFVMQVFGNFRFKQQA